MFNIPLPPRPDLEQYKTRAKELVDVAESKDADAIHEWVTSWIRSLAKQLNADIERHYKEAFERDSAELVTMVREQRKRAKKGRFGLADAQFLIAKVHGFKDWTAFAKQIGGPEDPAHRRFESAVDAVVLGDLDALTSLLKEHPDLVRARSHREHRCTLLHYVAANGVEDYRQRTPHHAVAIARSLLDAGAEVDALAETYGGGHGQTTMNLLVSSTHPNDAGLQGALAEVLLDHGAAIEGPDDDGSPVQTALAFGYVETAEALVRRGARIGNITIAASLGRLDLVKQFVEARLPEPKESLLKLYWSGVPRDRRLRQLVALHWACAYGRLNVVKYFLDLGMDPAKPDDNKMTPLHNACSGAHIEIVKLLLARKVPLEKKNTWGGTVINSTIHFASQGRRSPERDAKFAAVIELLIAAGADLSVVDYVTDVEPVDAVLDRHRPRPKE